MARPEQVDVWIGLDVGKEDHFAEVLDDAGERIFGRGWLPAQITQIRIAGNHAIRSTPTAHSGGSVRGRLDRRSRFVTTVVWLGRRGKARQV